MNPYCPSPSLQKSIPNLRVLFTTHDLGRQAIREVAMPFVPGASILAVPVVDRMKMSVEAISEFAFGFN